MSQVPRQPAKTSQVRGPKQEDSEEDSEEVWRNRSSHRQNGVDAIKRSATYIIAEASQIQRPKSPDAQDRALSKRVWERTVQQWRRDLLGLVKSLSRDARMDVGPLKLGRCRVSGALRPFLCT